MMTPVVLNLIVKFAAVALVAAAAVYLIMKLGVRKARQKMAERSLERARNANEIDERISGADDAELDELFRRSQE